MEFLYFTILSIKPLLKYFKEGIMTTLLCAGMDNIQIGSILAQIDCALTDAQHDFLHSTMVLKDESKNKLVCNNY